MKRFVCLFVAMLVVLLLPAVAHAEEQISVTVKSGDTVYVTVVLNQAVEGTTMGISCSLDTALLEPVAKDCEWEVEGLLSDFNEKGMGVWTTNEAVKLEGNMVTLAFRPLTEKAVTTEITCTLIVKNGSDEVGRFTAVGKVTLDGKQTVETRPAETTTPPATQTQETHAAGTEGATRPAATTGKETMETASYSETPDGVLTIGATETETPDNGWLLWLLGLVIVGAAAAAAVLLRKRKR